MQGVARSVGHRIRSGTHTVANLTSTYEVSALPVQSDQSPILWQVAGEGSTVPTPARVVTQADLSRAADGFYSFQWRFSFMTFGMVSYWLTTYLASGVRSADVTVMTYDATNTAVYLQCLINRPEFPSSEAQISPTGWSNVIWRFTRGVIIT